jgi:anti-anti-sigma factor
MRAYERKEAHVVEFEQDDFCNPWHLEEAFEQLMDNLKHHRVVVDLSHVQSTMSLGIAVLVAFQGLALIHGTPISFAAVRPGVSRLLGLSGADRVLTVFDSVDAAFAPGSQGGSQ